MAGTGCIGWKRNKRKKMLETRHEALAEGEEKKK